MDFVNIVDPFENEAEYEVEIVLRGYVTVSATSEDVAKSRAEDLILDDMNQLDHIEIIKNIPCILE